MSPVPSTATSSWSLSRKVARGRETAALLYRVPELPWKPVNRNIFEYEILDDDKHKDGEIRESTARPRSTTLTRRLEPVVAPREWNDKLDRGPGPRAEDPPNGWLVVERDLRSEAPEEAAPPRPS